MKKIILAVAVAALAVIAASSLAVSSAFASPVTSVVYDAVPSPTPGNVASLGFQATSTSEFGDYVHLAGTDRKLDSVTVTMSDWANYADYENDSRYSGNPSNWTHPVTVNVYSNHLGANGAPDTLLATKTQTVTIPWHPVGSAFNGIAFNATFDTFDLSTPNVTLPNDVIVGIAYNTADYGAAPIHKAGPYDSLNIGIPTGQTAGVGTDDSAANVFWNTSHAPFYADGGPAGVGIFRLDTNWTPNGTVALKISTVAKCQPTGFVRDGINLTAAQIGGAATGTIDATGCNIGVYNPTSVNNANISGANYYGVVVSKKTAVNVTNSSIHNIGDVPFSGNQHGVGILYTTLDQGNVNPSGSATGTVSNNTVATYQKNGIVVSGAGAAVTVQSNTVTGLGPVSFIAQNGIQISFGATASVIGNTVSGNNYTPKSTTACGLLFFDASGVKQSSNNMFANESNLCNVGRGGGNVNAG